ncbi:MAG: helix-turn-helix domain-containing protein [Candidatus Hodarchaeota archaeon]
MIQTKLDISPKDYPTCKITRKTDVKVTIVAIQYPEGYGYVEALNGSEKTIRDYVNASKTLKDVEEYEVLFSSPSIYWTRSIFSQDFPSIYKTILEVGSMPLLPLIIARGVQHYTILSPSSNLLKKLLKTLKERFTSIEIISLSSIPQKLHKSLLSPKQSEAFNLAYNEGYYNIPRKIKIEDMAYKLGIKRTAMQERLRRAEKQIFTDYVKKFQ